MVTYLLCYVVREINIILNVLTFFTKVVIWKNLHMLHHKAVYLRVLMYERKKNLTTFNGEGVMQCLRELHCRITNKYVKLSKELFKLKHLLRDFF